MKSDPATQKVVHRVVEIDGLRVFLREAGVPDAPSLLLPHGYPCSSFQYRRLLPALADRYHLIAPDFPGFGFSETPGADSFHFDAYCDFLEKLVDALGLGRFALYLHDYGSQIGLRLAIRRPDRVTALIIQNGDIYEDVLGPKYAAIREYWKNSSAENEAVLREAISEEGFRAEFVGEIAETHLIPPELWKLHWPLMNTPDRRELCFELMKRLKNNLAWFPRYQAYLRQVQPPTLIVWGPEDGYMPKASAHAYLRDLPLAELHLLEGAGHWLLESHFEEALPLMRDFLGRALQPYSHSIVAGGLLEMS